MYSWWWVKLSTETCRIKPLRRINAIVASCCIYFTMEMAVRQWFRMNHTHSYCDGAFKFLYWRRLRRTIVVSCAVPAGNVSWMLFQEGRNSKLGWKRGVGQAAYTHTHTLAIISTSSVLEFILHELGIMLLKVKCMEFYCRDCGSIHLH